MFETYVLKKYAFKTCVPNAETPVTKPLRYICMCICMVSLCSLYNMYGIHGLNCIYINIYHVHICVYNIDGKYCIYGISTYDIYMWYMVYMLCMI